MPDGRDGRCPYGRWLADLSFPSTPQHVALQEYRNAIDETEQRIGRLTEQLRQLASTWRWAPVVAALQALRGVSFVTAVALGRGTRRPPRGLVIRASSWRIWDSCRRNTPVGRASDVVASPRRAIRMCDVSSRKPRGRTPGFRASGVSMRRARKR